MSSMERENNFQQEETPEEIQKRLLREEESKSQRLQEMENIPDYEVVSGKFKKISVEAKRVEAQRMAQEKDKIDARQQLNEAYAGKPQDEGVEIKTIPGRRNRVEIKKGKAA